MNVIKKIRVINKILALVEEIEKIKKAKEDQVKKILAEIGELSPQLKKVVNDIINLIKV